MYLADRLKAWAAPILGSHPVMALRGRHFPRAMDLRDSQRHIASLLRSTKPYFIGRAGSNEMCMMLELLRRGEVCFRKGRMEKISLEAGVVPANRETFSHVAERQIGAYRELDFVGTWLRGEKELFGRFGEKRHTLLRNLEPFQAMEPWTDALAGLRVIVVSPFVRSIAAQYDSRSKCRKLFPLPDFHLLTLESPQTNAGNMSAFDNWVVAMRFLEQAIRMSDFDVALIGCGAYGLPLGAYVKSLAKKAIVLGGALAPIFSVYGQRHLDDARIGPYINEQWIRPGLVERPIEYQRVEGGCYW